ncbi:PREDICTED: xaa-Pro aminopeptidase 1-like [Priapulus caudatus]|uniref:Xaa-Pro aminopeptidase 1-like n=1 Tax=Priapulus caudatus TaxID=37621 RepID=A0ABM1EPE7_PRICU|nr:PREDICTED: xaa-Pro aminopeptidase 1-like [Priapulus caudatus]
MYVDPTKLTDEVKEHLKMNNCKGGATCVQQRPYEKVFDDVADFSAAHDIVIISAGSSYAIYSEVPKMKRLISQSPIVMRKAQKNDVEIKNYKNCQIRDSAALAIFLEMLESDLKSGSRTWNEMSAQEKLAEIRRGQLNNRGLSFGTISASGANGAVIHYTSQPSTNRTLTTSEMYLLDSGGQYLDCTTDVTRTMHYGEPTDFQKEAYTRVLQGSIDYANAIFPQTSYTSIVETYVRIWLWEAGLEYRHGSSHGVGVYLYVHEDKGPISDPLQPGIFMSDEPGYYEVGEFGVRLETIIMSKIADTPNNYDGLTFMTFEPVTFVPFEPNLIKYEDLSIKQRKWLNAYNEKCRQLTGEELRRQGQTAAHEWLMRKTEPIPDYPECTASGGASARPTLLLLLLAVASNVLYSHTSHAYGFWRRVLAKVFLES